MYASIRRCRMGAGWMDDAMHLADTELADRITADPGFVDYQAIDTGDGPITSVTIFDDEDQCLRSNDLAAEFLRDHLAAFEVERIDVFGSDVMVCRAADTRSSSLPTTDRTGRAAREVHAPLLH